MSDGRLALTFDDGYLEDYRDLWPVLRERDVPAAVAISPDWLGEADYVSVDQLRDLVDDGWEVVAHGRRHRYLQAHGLAADAVAGDERVVVDGGHVFPESDHGVYPGDAFEMTDGTRAETHVLAEKGEGAGDKAGSGEGVADDGDGAVLTFETALESGFEASETVVRPAESQLRDEIVGGKRDLEDLGFDPVTFALPYDAGDSRAWRLVADNFDALVNASVRSLPNVPGTPPLGLQRYYLETDAMRMVEIAAYLDMVAEENGLGILAGHSAWDTVPPERVAAVVDAAHDRDIEVTTIRDAVAR